MDAFTAAIIGILAGGTIVFLVTYFFYVKKNIALAAEIKRLRDQSDLLLRILAEAGCIKVSLDPKTQQIVGIDQIERLPLAKKPAAGPETTEPETPGVDKTDPFNLIKKGKPQKGGDRIQ